MRPVSAMLTSTHMNIPHTVEVLLGNSSLDLEQTLLVVADSPTFSQYCSEFTEGPQEMLGKSEEGIERNKKGEIDGDRQDRQME